MVQFWRELDIALVQNKKKFDMKSELQISCVFAFFTLWKWVKTYVLSDQSVHLRIHIAV